MERFFRSLETEWMPKFGYTSFDEAEHSITNYVAGYYTQLRPHQYNSGKPLKLWPDLLDHFNTQST